MPKHKCELASSKSNLNNDNLSARDQFPSDGSLLQLQQKGSKIVVQPSVDKWRKTAGLIVVGRRAVIGANQFPA